MRKSNEFRAKSREQEIITRSPAVHSRSSSGSPGNNFQARKNPGKPQVRDYRQPGIERRPLSKTKIEGAELII